MRRPRPTPDRKRGCVASGSSIQAIDVKARDPASAARRLYVSAAQVGRRPEYIGGEDLQKPPYAVLRIRIDAGPA